MFFIFQKKIIPLLLIVFLLLPFHVSAQNLPQSSEGGDIPPTESAETDPKQRAINEYREELSFLNQKLSVGEQLTTPQIEQIAQEQVSDAIQRMTAAQDEVWYSFDNLETRIQKLPKNDPRKNVIGEILGDSKRFGAEAVEAWEEITAPFTEKGETKVQQIDYFLGLAPAEHVEIISSLGGSLPMAEPDDTFRLAEEEAKGILSQAYQAMIAPSKPQNVPEGDLIGDFIPRIIRLLFRFAWFMVFISLIVSGAIFIVGASKEEWLDKGKRIAYFTVIGFAIVALSFAIVKAITDIDFFRIF